MPKIRVTPTKNARNLSSKPAVSSQPASAGAGALAETISPEINDEVKNEESVPAPASSEASTKTLAEKREDYLNAASNKSVIHGRRASKWGDVGSLTEAYEEMSARSRAVSKSADSAPTVGARSESDGDRSIVGSPSPISTEGSRGNAPSEDHASPTAINTSNESRPDFSNEHHDEARAFGGVSEEMGGEETNEAQTSPSSVSVDETVAPMRASDNEGAVGSPISGDAEGALASTPTSTIAAATETEASGSSAPSEVTNTDSNYAVQTNADDHASNTASHTEPAKSNTEAPTAAASESLSDAFTGHGVSSGSFNESAHSAVGSDRENQEDEGLNASVPTSTRNDGVSDDDGSAEKKEGEHGSHASADEEAETNESPAPSAEVKPETNSTPLKDSDGHVADSASYKETTKANTEATTAAAKESAGTAPISVRTTPAENSNPILFNGLVTFETLAAKLLEILNAKGAYKNVSGEYDNISFNNATSCVIKFTHILNGKEVECNLKAERVKNSSSSTLDGFEFKLPKPKTDNFQGTEKANLIAAMRIAAAGSPSGSVSLPDFKLDEHKDLFEKCLEACVEAGVKIFIHNPKQDSWYANWKHSTDKNLDCVRIMEAPRNSQRSATVFSPKAMTAASRVDATAKKSSAGAAAKIDATDAIATPPANATDREQTAALISSMIPPPTETPKAKDAASSGPAKDGNRTLEASA